MTFLWLWLLSFDILNRTTHSDYEARKRHLEAKSLLIPAMENMEKDSTMEKENDCHRLHELN